MTERSKCRTIVGGLAIGLAACGGEAAEESSASDADSGGASPAASVTIIEPAAGASIDGSDVRVVLEVEGIEIVPVAEARMGTAHHHLFLDVDVTPAGPIIPLDDPQIIHMGDGRSEHTFEGLEPGEHRVIAVLADPAHIPLDPPARDTVRFTVGG